MRRLQTVLTVIGAITVLVLGGNAVAYAATGGKFILGKTNKANASSILKRTTAGAPLTLRTQSSANPPLSTNGSGRVANLNADMLDGKDSGAFQTKVGALAWTDLELGSGWSACGTGKPQYAIRLGIVYLRGSLCSGADGSLGFTVPAAARPVRSGTFIYFPVQQCNGATGRVSMHLSTGQTTIVSDPDDAAAATCFVSLEGITYPLS